MKVTSLRACVTVSCSTLRTHPLPPRRLWLIHVVDALTLIRFAGAIAIAIATAIVFDVLLPFPPPPPRYPNFHALALVLWPVTARKITSIGASLREA